MHHDIENKETSNEDGLAGDITELTEESAQKLGIPKEQIVGLMI